MDHHSRRRQSLFLNLVFPDMDDDHCQGTVTTGIQKTLTSTTSYYTVKNFYLYASYYYLLYL